MRVLKFELKKIWKQKKLYWIFAIVLLVTSGIFIQNTLEKKNMEDRALQQFEPFIEDTHAMGEEMRLRQLHGALSEQEEKQYEHIKAISTAFFHWKRLVREGLWEKVPAYENDFLTHVQEFENHGGVYTPLQGIDREKRIAKNNWMIEHNLAYEDEEYPTSPHLFLKETTTILLGVLGIVILLLFFGNFISVEKEQNTWMALKTQPIPKLRLFLGKYYGALFTILSFIILVIVMGVIIPFIFGDYSLHLIYPQIVTTGDSFAIISTFQYIFRALSLFICASAYAFGIALFVSKWIQQSFTVLMITVFILILGFTGTQFIESTQSVLNPFQTLNMTTIIDAVPQATDWLYVLVTLFWVIALIGFAVNLPDKNIRFFNFSDVKNPFKKGKVQPNGRLLWSSVLFEARKVERRGILIQVSAFTLLLMILGSLILSHESAQKEAENIGNIKKMIEMTKNQLIPNMIDSLEESKELERKNEDSNVDYSHGIKMTEEIIEFYEEDILIMKKAIKDYENNDWLPFLEYQLDINRFQNNEFESETGAIGSHSKDSVGPMTLEASVAEKHWLMEKNIQPLFPGHSIHTIFHEWDDPELEKNWIKGNEKIAANGLYSLYYYFNKLIYLVPILLLLFVVGGGLSEERGKKDTIRLLRTQPVNMRNIFGGKVLYSIGISIISSIGFILFVVIIGTVLDRLGDWYYPILHYDSQTIAQATDYTGSIPREMDVGYHFKPLGKILLANIGLFLCMLIFVITIAHVFSLWIKNKLSVLASTIIFCVVSYVISANVLESKAHLSPFTYFDISRITNGEISTVLDNPAVNVQYGVVVMVISIVVILSIGYLTLLFQRK